MALRPTDFPEWAIDALNEIKVIDGITTVLPNKLEPSAEFKLSGEKFRENLPRQYINFQFDLIDEWFKHLDGKYAVGDVFTTTSTESVAVLSARLGGTWTARGTQDLGTLIAVKIYEKTA